QKIRNIVNTKYCIFTTIGIIVLVVFAIRFGFGDVRKNPSSDRSDGSTEEHPINPNIPSQAGGILATFPEGTHLLREGNLISIHPGMELKSGDRLDMASGTATIVWPHYGRTTLASGTILEMQKVFESTNRERFDIRLRLVEGRIWTRFE